MSSLILIFESVSKFKIPHSNAKQCRRFGSGINWVSESSYSIQEDKRASEKIKTVFQIRIRIHMFLGLPYPDLDPLVRGMNLEMDPSISKQK
jgi:hypothetical protein